MIPAIQLYAGLQGVYLALLDDRLNDPLDDPLNDSVAVAHNWPQQQAWALSWIMLEQYDYIRTACRVYGKSIWQICRETGQKR